MQNTTESPKGSFLLIPIRDTPKTAEMIATQLIPKWSGEAIFILSAISVDSLTAISQSLYLYSRKNFQYRLAPQGKELIRSPYQSWNDRKDGIDCEDYVILIASCLLQLDYVPDL